MNNIIKGRVNDPSIISIYSNMISKCGDMICSDDIVVGFSIENGERMGDIINMLSIVTEIATVIIIDDNDDSRNNQRARKAFSKHFGVFKEIPDVYKHRIVFIKTDDMGGNN